MRLLTNFTLPTEIQDVAKLFFADVEIVTEQPADIVLSECPDGDDYHYVATFFAMVETQKVSVANVDELQKMRLRKRFAKICTYNLLSKVTGKSMPWGSLTGIRPTKLARQLVREGLDWKKTFADILGVSNEKISLVNEILTVQSGLSGIGGTDLYVGVPFCVSRCSYCSFTSGEIDRLRKYVEPYVSALKKDVRQTIDFARKNDIKIDNVYFGGGTPTSLSVEQLDEVLSEIDFVPTEFTVEAGRPDTLDENKLQVLAKHGINRISVNPQTFNQSVLDVIGRKHSVQDIYDKYYLARSYGFVINMDLIAGLPSESYEMFCHSVDCAIELDPDNITVHTLALKHGSVLKEQNYAAGTFVGKMVDYASDKLHKAGYMPYYMYRQKYVMENLENVGYCKVGKACLYNVGIMEEMSSILACGTNAISKKVVECENRIERAANAKDVITYIDRIDDYLQKKFALFDKNAE